MNFNRKILVQTGLNEEKGLKEIFQNCGDNKSEVSKLFEPIGC
jgi:hypothetical protein